MPNKGRPRKRRKQKLRQRPKAANRDMTLHGLGAVSPKRRVLAAVTVLKSLFLGIGRLVSLVFVFVFWNLGICFGGRMFFVIVNC